MASALSQGVAGFQGLGQIGNGCRDAVGLVLDELRGFCGGIRNFEEEQGSWIAKEVVYVRHGGVTAELHIVQHDSLTAVNHSHSQ